MSKPELTLITLTGDRPEAFSLCERWMSRQSYARPVQWIIADDGREPAKCTLGQTVLRLEPMAGNSFCRNLRAVLDAGIIAGEKIAFIEDDDFYGRDWLDTVADTLDDAGVCGEGFATYYHVGRRALWQHDNAKHASLCATAIGAELLPALRSIAGGESPFIDVALWRLPVTRCLWPPRGRPGVVGIKGMPGRLGIGAGHDPTCDGYKPDPELYGLSKLIGPEAETYRGFAWSLTAKAV